jgi:hypothetical protein
MTGKRSSPRSAVQQALKLKRLVLTQREINAAKRYFGTHSEQKAIKENQRLSRALRPLKGILKGVLSLRALSVAR